MPIPTSQRRAFHPLRRRNEIVTFLVLAFGIWPIVRGWASSVPTAFSSGCSDHFRATPAASALRRRGRGVGISRRDFLSRFRSGRVGVSLCQEQPRRP